MRSLRCAACHVVPGEPEALAGPALHSLRGNVSRAWLVDWLASAGSEQQPATRRMPHFSFNRREATAVADALLAASEPLPEPAGQSKAAPKTDSANKKSKKKDNPNRRGRVPN